jgi:hypothetical protein
MKSKQSGFTLTDLLVVISIMTLLAFVLLPSLGHAREQSKINVCAAHLSQIGKAVLIYTSDAAGILPSPGVYSSGVKKGIPVIQYLDNQSCSDHYTYNEYHNFGATGSGAQGIGCLFLTGLLANDSDIVYCPNFRNPAFASYDGHRYDHPFNDWNSKGDPAHYNYCGVNSTNNYHLLPADETKIGWMNMRVSYGFRPMVNLGIKNLSQTSSGMSYLSDVWYANANWYNIHIDEVSHVNRGSTEADLHGWYFDGHVERKTLARNIYFKTASTYSLTDGFMNDGSTYRSVTWAHIFENKPYP